MLAEHDRPLHQRQHRAEIRRAKQDVAELSGKLHELNQELTDLMSRHAAENKAQHRTITAATTRPEDRAIDQTEAALGIDARTRGEQIAADPDPRYVEHLGPAPDNPEAQEHWIEAAGRVAQHHTLWGQPTGAAFVGHMPTFNNDDDYRHTFYAANQAIHHLDRTIGIPHPAHGREAPGLSL